MDDLLKALDDISSIRRQVAERTEFRGYGPATLAATGGLALLTAGAQEAWLPEPSRHMPAYLGLWSTTAFIAAGLAGWQMYTRSRRMHSGLSHEMIRMAVEQFVPSLGVGVLLTFVLARFVPGSVWMLPGLWQVCSSLGIFSSCRFLPRPMMAAGGWYLLSGLCCLALGDGRALAPWTMGLGYGVGQLLVAGVLLLATKEAGDEG